MWLRLLGLLGLLGLLLVLLTTTPERRGVLLLVGWNVGILLLESLLLHCILLLLLRVPTPYTTTSQSRIDIATIILLSKPTPILRLLLLRLLSRRCISPFLLQSLPRGRTKGRRLGWCPTLPRRRACFCSGGVDLGVGLVLEGVVVCGSEGRGVGDRLGLGLVEVVSGGGDGGGDCGGSGGCRSRTIPTILRKHPLLWLLLALRLPSSCGIIIITIIAPRPIPRILLLRLLRLPPRIPLRLPPCTWPRRSTPSIIISPILSLLLLLLLLRWWRCRLPRGMWPRQMRDILTLKRPLLLLLRLGR